MHLFARDEKYYDSETGNWIGKCSRCGSRLIMYTGARSVEPEEVGSYTVARVGSAANEDTFIISHGLFAAGKPNAIVYNGPCNGSSRSSTEKRLFAAAGVEDFHLRIFDDSTFWIEVACDPSERSVLFALFDRMKKLHDYR